MDTPILAYCEESFKNIEGILDGSSTPSLPPYGPGTWPWASSPWSSSRASAASDGFAARHGGRGCGRSILELKILHQISQLSLKHCNLALIEILVILRNSAKHLVEILPNPVENVQTCAAFIENGTQKTVHTFG